MFDSFVASKIPSHESTVSGGYNKLQYLQYITIFHCISSNVSIKFTLNLSSLIGGFAYGMEVNE